MTSTDDDTLAIVGLLIAMKRKNKGKMWCKEWLQKRNTHSHVNFHKQNSQKKYIASSDWLQHVA
jgi:hypothetical protein